MKDRLAGVLWIGGSPCSGKSTIADRLAAAFDLGICRCDDASERQLEPALQPVFARLVGGSCDGVWMRPVWQQIEEERELDREEFPMIPADLLAFPSLQGGGGSSWVPTLVAAGATLMPERLATLSPEPSRAVWIVPGEAFQRQPDRRRMWRHEVLKTRTDVALAWGNWIAGDAGVARAGADDARRMGYRVIDLDGSRTLDQVYAGVAVHVGVAPRGRAPKTR